MSSLKHKEIIIVGARGMGRELLGYLQEEGYSIKGFLDGGINPTDWQLETPLLGAPETWIPSENERFLIALGDAQWRRHYVDLLAQKGAKFATFVSKCAYVGPRVTIGEGSILSPTAVITADAVVGKHCILNIHASISHDCKVGDYVTFSPGSRITGRCTLEDDVFLGVNAALIPDVSIAQGSIIGAGALVTKSIFEQGKTHIGIPAKVLEKE